MQLPDRSVWQGPTDALASASRRSMFVSSADREPYLGSGARKLRGPAARLLPSMLLWHLAERSGHVSPRGVVLPLPLTHAVLGSLVVTSREGWVLRGAPSRAANCPPG
jgi:hypothetical protein